MSLPIEKLSSDELAREVARRALVVNLVQGWEPQLANGRANKVRFEVLMIDGGNCKVRTVGHGAVHLADPVL